MIMQKAAGPLFALLMAALLNACGEPARHTVLPADALVLAFGDSATAGTGAAEGEDYPSQLAENTGWRVINAGIPGDTAQRAGQRIGDLLLQYQPELVIVGLGGNDFLRRRSPAAVKEDLRAIAKQAKDAGAAVALIAVPEFSVIRASLGRLTDAPIYRELAEEEGLILVPEVFASTLSDEDLRADPIHPNARGYRQMAEGIEQALAEAGLLAP